MIRSLVTGGSGFIGSNLALQLESIGHQVTVLDSLSSGSHDNLKEFKGEKIQCDISEPYQLNSAFDFIFHQAAITDPRHGNDHEVFQKNMQGFEQVIKWAQNLNARLIYASTAGLYGNGKIPMIEDQEKEIISEYGRSKWEADKLAEKYFSKLPIVGLRYFNVFGPQESHKGRPASMVYHLARQMFQGNRPRLFKFGEHVRDFIYVKDIVRANISAITAPSGIYNVGTGIGTSFNELVAVLNKVLQSSFEAEYFDMPYDPKTYQFCTVADISLAKAKLGFESQWGLEMAVADYVQWLKDNKQLN